jgi:pectinesterase
LYRCKLRGYQDTLCRKNLSSKQLMRECTISGTVNVIFGAAAAVFQNCDIRARMLIQGQENTITAHGRLSPNDSGGFSFQACTVAVDEDLAHAAKGTVQTYLGRPWKPFSRVVFMESTISPTSSTQGLAAVGARRPTGHALLR